MSTTISSREFNQDTGGAKKAATHGPVFITDRGHPAYVLLAFEEYQRLVKGQASIGELLAMTDADAVEFAPPRLGEDILRSATFSDMEPSA